MSATKSNRGRNLTIWVALIVIIAAVFGFRFQQLGQTEAMASIRSVQESEGIPVETVTVERSDLSRWITLAGTVEGAVQYSIKSQNALPVIAIEVAEGDAVRAGDVILRLATGAPSPMYHSLDRSRASYDNDLRDAKRLRNLFTEGAVSQADLDAAETRLKVAAADLADAEGSAALVATEDGIVTSILVETGETTPVNKPLVWIASTETVRLCFEAGSAQALSLAIGQPARWVLPDGGVGGEGAVSQLDLMADPATHLLAGEASFANGDGRLVPGLLVSFNVRTVYQPGALTVPTACLVDADGQEAVWTVATGKAGYVAELRPVQTGARDSDRVEITAGLDEGESVVRHGQTLLEPGLLVKQITAEEK